MRTLALALLLALTADVAHAQVTAGVVLMVEDQPRPEAERLGVVLFGGILEHGPALPDPYLVAEHAKGKPRLRLMLMLDQQEHARGPAVAQARAQEHVGEALAQVVVDHT